MENAEGQEALNGDSQHTGTSSSEMLKPFLKTLGKKYYQNETLAKYDTLSDAIDSLLSRPERKEIPESYGLREGTDEMFRKAGLTKAEAEAIESYYGKLIPKAKPDLKEHFGDKYDETIKLYEKGVKGISSDLAEEISKNGLDKDPTFVNILARVGKEVGSKTFVAPVQGANSQESAAERFLRKHGVV